jgi:beta-lactamase class A
VHLRARVLADLQAIAERVDGVMSYTAVDLSSGDRFGFRDTTVSPTASTIKLAILYELFRQSDEKRVNLDEPIPFDRARAVPGSGVLFELAAPVMPLRDYATLMVVLSDNSATNLLIERLGMAAITERARQLGLPNTKLRRAMMDLDAAKRGDENISTAAEIAQLLEIFYKGAGLSAGSREQALTILKKEKDTALVRGVPAGVPVACKPGELDGVRVDAGIVFAANRPYILSVMLTYLADDKAGDRAIEEASRVAYRYFSRLGAGGDYGRSIER